MSQSLASLSEGLSYPTTIQSLTDEDIPQCTPLPGELWTPINGTNSRYFVSNMGRVLTRVYYNHPRWHLLKPFSTGKSYKIGRGYLQVKLYLEDGTWMRPKVHRLVAEHFIPNPDNLPQIDHIDNDPLNNRAENLQWVTNRQNTQLRFERQGKLSFEKAEMLREEFSRTGLTKERFCVAWAEQLGVCRNTIRFCLDGTTWQSEEV